VTFEEMIKIGQIRIGPIAGEYDDLTGHLAFSGRSAVREIITAATIQSESAVHLGAAATKQNPAGGFGTGGVLCSQYSGWEYPSSQAELCRLKALLSAR
jgi:hypothetical protein